LRGGSESIHGLLLFIAVGLVLLALWQFRNANHVAGLIAGLVGVAVGLWFFLTDSVPEDLTGMTPYLATLLVLALASQRLRMPAADGKTYRRGSAG
jgi:simple sugar transport system permease protein